MSFDSGDQGGAWEAQGSAWPPPPSGPPLSFDPPPPDGGPPSPRRRIPRAVLIGGAAVGMALGGAGIAFAAGSSSTTTPTTKPSAGAQPQKHHRGFGGFGGFRRFGGFGGIGGRVVHGEYTVQNSSGGYTTLLVQTGKASSVSSSSITVTSTDGYKHTYTVVSSTIVDAQRDGIATVSSGDQVQVVATRGGGKDTASDIIDTTKLAAGNPSFGLKGGFPGPEPRGWGQLGGPAGASPAGPASF